MIKHVRQVTMVTSARKNVSAGCLIWPKNVIIGTENVTANQDLLVSTATKLVLQVPTDLIVRTNVFARIIRLVITHLVIVTV